MNVDKTILAPLISLTSRSAEKLPRCLEVELDIRPDTLGQTLGRRTRPPRLVAQAADTVGHVGPLTSWLLVLRGMTEGAISDERVRVVTAASDGSLVTLDQLIGTQKLDLLCQSIEQALTKAKATNYLRPRADLRGYIRERFVLRVDEDKVSLTILLPEHEGTRFHFARLAFEGPTLSDVLQLSVAARTSNDLFATMTGCDDAPVTAARVSPSEITWPAPLVLPVEVKRAVREPICVAPIVDRLRSSTQTFAEAKARLTNQDMWVGSQLVGGARSQDIANRLPAKKGKERSETYAETLVSAFCFKVGANRVRATGVALAMGLGKTGRARPDFARLSPLAQDVLKLICEGLSNEEIAGRLSKGIGVIKTTVNEIHATLETNGSRTLAAALAFEFELVPLPTEPLKREGFSDLPDKLQKALLLYAEGGGTRVTPNLVRALDRLGLDHPWQAAEMLASRVGGAGQDLARFQGLRGLDRRMIEMLVAGLGKQEMAGALGLRVPILEKRMNSLLSTLNITNWLQAACTAIQAGYRVPDRPPGSVTLVPGAEPASLPTPIPHWEGRVRPPKSIREALWRLSEKELTFFRAMPIGLTESTVGGLDLGAAAGTDVIERVRFKMAAPSRTALGLRAVALKLLPDGAQEQNGKPKLTGQSAKVVEALLAAHLNGRPRTAGWFGGNAAVWEPVAAAIAYLHMPEKEFDEALRDAAEEMGLPRSTRSEVQRALLARAFAAGYGKELVEQPRHWPWADALDPAEYKVGEQYAKGISNKLVGDDLGRTPGGTSGSAATLKDLLHCEETSQVVAVLHEAGKVETRATDKQLRAVRALPADARFAYDALGCAYPKEAIAGPLGMTTKVLESRLKGFHPRPGGPSPATSFPGWLELGKVKTPAQAALVAREVAATARA